jgi:hypothetical protein
LLPIGEEHRAFPCFGVASLRSRDMMRALVEQVLRQLVGSLPRMMEN